MKTIGQKAQMLCKVAQAPVTPEDKEKLKASAEKNLGKVTKGIKDVRDMRGRLKELDRMVAASKKGKKGKKGKKVAYSGL